MKKHIKYLFITFIITGTVLASLSGCNLPGTAVSKETETAEEVSTEEEQDGEVVAETSEFTEVAKIPGIEFDHEIVIERAQYLSIDSYKDGYYVIKSHKGKFLQQILVVPEGKSVPEGIGEDILIIQKPINSSKIDSITLAELLTELGDDYAAKLSFVSVESDNIFVDKILANMEKGVTKYAGTAKDPDLNLIKDSNLQVYICNSGLVKEAVYKKIQDLGITPFVSFIHQEADPLGRIEWVKALGIIYGDLQAGEDFFNRQKELLDSVDKTKAQSKTYAFICLKKDNNKAYVRRTGDVIAKMGELAGGINKLSDNPKGGWEVMSIDDFISKYKDTDYIIYLNEHGDKVTSFKELLAISDKLSEFKAIESGNIWLTKTDYLQMNNVGEITAELNRIFAGEALEGNYNCFINIK